MTAHPELLAIFIAAFMVGTILGHWFDKWCERRELSA